MNGGFQEYGIDVEHSQEEARSLAPGKTWVVLASLGLPSVWVQHLAVCKTGFLYHSKCHSNSHVADCSKCNLVNV